MSGKDGKANAWFTLREYATLTGEHIDAVRSQCRRGRLPAEKKGEVWVIYLSALKARCPSLWESLLQKKIADNAGKRSRPLGQARSSCVRLSDTYRGVGQARRRCAHAGTRPSGKG